MISTPNPGNDDHQLVFLVRTQLNPGNAEAFTRELPAHLHFLSRLYSEGRLLFGGPLIDSNNHNTGNGIYVVRAETFSEAKELAAQDPLHRQGIRTAEVHKWMLKTDYST